METLTAHTPSPWTVTERIGNPCFGIRAIEFLICAGTGNAFANVSLGGRGATDTTPAAVEANARLISASPDLLAALQATCADLADLSLCIDGGDSVETMRAVLEKNRARRNAAIAKAEGRA